MAQATPTALNLDESYYQRSGDNVYPGLAKQVKEASAWPTPRSGDGDKGGPNQRGSKGDLMLPSAVQVEWRTPAVQDPGITVARLTGDLGGRLYDKETGRNCQYGLTQQVELAERVSDPLGGIGW